MKKLISIILTVLLIFCGTVNASAMGLLSQQKGDADLNGKITANDARLILRSSVGLYIPSILSWSSFDADGNGKISASDARLTLRWAVGLDLPSKDTPDKKETAAKKLSDKVSADELDRLMKAVCGTGTRSVFYPEKNRQAADYIFSELKKAGLSPRMQYFTYNSVRTQNVTAVLNEGGGNGEILLLSTHYDCWDKCEGAIDNASGVASLLHIVRLIKESQLSFNKEIRIAFFSAEELGYFGAYHYISTLSDSEKDRLSVLNIDMAGNSLLGGGKMLTVSTNSVYVSGAESNEISRALDKGKAFTGNIGEEKYYSSVSAGKHDIVPFENEGIPAATLSWREINPDASNGSQYDLAPPSQIHTFLDTYANFNKASLLMTTKLIINTLVLSYTK